MARVTKREAAQKIKTALDRVQQARNDPNSQQQAIDAARAAIDSWAVEAESTDDDADDTTEEAPAKA
jgi:hypothetical protein